MINQIEGSIVALVTPMLDNGDVDYESLKSLVKKHISLGTKAIVSVGTTGESPTLTHQEHIEVIKKTIEFTEGKIPVIAGTGSNSTHEAIEMNKSLENDNVKAFLMVAPYYNKPTQEGIYQHFKKIAENTKHDIILYNVPGRTVSDIKPETVARLAKIKNIIGIKEATGEVVRVSQIKALVDDDFILLSGDDATALEFIKEGGNGVISVINNAMIEDFAKLCEFALKKDFVSAEMINKKYCKLYKLLFAEGNPIPIKWVCYKLGLIKTPTLRLPLTLISKELKEQISQELSNLNLI